MLPTELQEYLDEHQVERLLKELLASLLFCKPEDPLDFMVSGLSEVKRLQAEGPGQALDFKGIFMGVGERMKQPPKPSEEEQQPQHEPSQGGKGSEASSLAGSTESNSTATSSSSSSSGGGGGSGANMFGGFAGDGFAPSDSQPEWNPDLGAGEESDQEEEEIGDLPSMGRPQPRGNIANMRRGSVSAESFKPSDEEYERTVVEKSPEARSRIEKAISNNLLFRNLEAEQRNEIIDAMFERKAEKGEMVIKQGDEGDNFYVVDQGSFDVLVKGNKVVEIHAGGSFGELALMYNTPRAASVVAAEDSVLWATDRVTFRRIVTTNMYRKRKLYESFLRTVPILGTLNESEVTKVADALEPLEFAPEEDIVRQGDEGDVFYIVVDGEAKVTITKDGEPHEMMRYRKGDYFGEIALINNSARAATVTAVSRVKCVSLNRAAFIRLLGPVIDILKRNIDEYKKYEEYDK